MYNTDITFSANLNMSYSTTLPSNPAENNRAPHHTNASIVLSPQPGIVFKKYMYANI